MASHDLSMPLDRASHCAPGRGILLDNTQAKQAMSQFQRYQILLKRGADYKVLILDFPVTKSGLATLEKCKLQGWEAERGCFPYDADEPVGELPNEVDFNSSTDV